MKMAGTRTVIFIPTVTKSPNPWVVRGGCLTDGTSAGAFTLSRTFAGGGSFHTFRSVLSRLNYGLKIVKKYFF